MLPCVRARSRGLTMVELLVAIGILSVLGLALAQLMSTGMATWRSGEVRRGAYERAQYVFDRVRTDLAELQPRDPEMPEAWVFQDYWLPGSFELHSGTVEEIGETGGKSDPDA
ncbi:MAG: prepilin-type N-terminal cleavage/methylation domain-containing protein, partial [Planctomycetota bacterium]